MRNKRTTGGWLSREDMAARVAQGRDPLSGRPRQTCGWNIVMRDGHPVCQTCGQQVHVTDQGDWAYGSRGPLRPDR